LKIKVNKANQIMQTVQPIPQLPPQPIQPVKLEYIIQEVVSKHKFHECHRCGIEYVRFDFHKKQPIWEQYWCSRCIENNEIDTKCPECSLYSILSDDYPYCEHCSYNPKTKKFQIAKKKSLAIIKWNEKGASKASYLEIVVGHKNQQAQVKTQARQNTLNELKQKVQQQRHELKQKN
jgi:hypothetical protein